MDNSTTINIVVNNFNLQALHRWSNHKRTNPGATCVPVPTQAELQAWLKSAGVQGTMTWGQLKKAIAKNVNFTACVKAEEGDNETASAGNASGTSPSPSASTSTSTSTTSPSAVATGSNDEDDTSASTDDSDSSEDTDGGTSGALQQAADGATGNDAATQAGQVASQNAAAQVGTAVMGPQVKSGDDAQDSLPHTGAQTGISMLLAGLLLAIGFVVILMTRSRREASRHRA